MRAYDRWRALPRREKRLVIEAAALASLWTLRIRLLGAPRLALQSRSHDAPSVEPHELRALATAVERAARYIPGATCLPCAVALQRVLKRRGIAADVRLGVRTEAGALFAHAWVEYGGVALDSSPPGDSFAALR